MNKLTKELYLSLTDKQKLHVLKSEENFTRLNITRINLDLGPHLKMSDAELLVLGTKFFEYHGQRGWPSVLFAPTFTSPVDPEFREQFTVAAGRFEYDGQGNQEVNYKYIESFPQLEAALAAAETCKGYPVIELTYVDSKGITWEVELREKIRA